MGCSLRRESPLGWAGIISHGRAEELFLVVPERYKGAGDDFPRSAVSVESCLFAHLFLVQVATKDRGGCIDRERTIHRLDGVAYLV